jgi:hypothetical protein
VRHGCDGDEACGDGRTCIENTRSNGMTYAACAVGGKAGFDERCDRDRDGDGIANAKDPHPNRPDARRYARTGPRGDLDRDGIQNRYDKDRDGDGIANARDKHPDRWDSHVASKARGDKDHDGIQNRYDRDRDGDGVANARDAYPNNKNRS